MPLATPFSLPLSLALLIAALGSPLSPVSSSQYLEPLTRQSVKQTSPFEHLILLGTLDGSLLAVDRYSGAIKWENGDIGGPLVQSSPYIAAKREGVYPFYMVEAYGDGYVHVMIPGESIKVATTCYSNLHLETAGIN